MPIGPARMPLMEHLGELRMRLVRIVAVLAIAVVIFYMASATLVSFLIQPIAEFIPDGALTTLTPFEGFSVRFKVSLWASVVACSPIILWQILAFFLPALKPNERKWFIPTFSVAVALFIFGTVFCYLIILDPAFQWLTDQSAGFANVQAQASTYVDVIIKFELGFGLAFELPLVIFYLIFFDVVPYQKLRSAWRTVYVVIMVISAMITPDASPVTMLLLFAAMIVLYEGSLLVSRLVLRDRIKEQNERLAREQAEEKAAEEEYERERAEREAEKKKAAKKASTTKKTTAKKTTGAKSASKTARNAPIVKKKQ